MLVISRKLNEALVIGNSIEVYVVDLRVDKVRLGLIMPKEISVHRKEVYELIGHPPGMDETERLQLMSRIGTWPTEKLRRVVQSHD